MNDYFVALGGGNEIGVSSYLIHVGDTNILIDAGLRLHGSQAFPDFVRLGELLGSITQLDAFLLTHAHLDHCGALTRLQYEHPTLAKYTTAPTKALAEIMLTDAIRIAKRHKSEDWSIIETTENLLDSAFDSLTPINFWESFQLGASDSYCMPLPAGHILGAASFLIEVEGRRILHTGDISLHAQRTIHGMDLGEIQDIDLLIIESTYAYQPYFLDETIFEQQANLARLVSNIINSGGNVLIPAFALGRAQEIASLFNDFFEQHLIEPFPILLDGLVQPISDIYNQYRDYLDARLRLRNGHAIYSQWIHPNTDKRPLVVDQDITEPMCIIASSGMLLEHTRSAHYAQQLLPDPQNAIIFSGYLDEESPGKMLSVMEKGASINLNKKDIPIKAGVHRYHLSAHGSSQELCSLMERLCPKQIILVHGDYSYQENAEFISFLRQLNKKGVEIHQAHNGQLVYLS